MIKARKLFAGFACLSALCATALLCTCLGTSYFIDASAQNALNRSGSIAVDCSDYSAVSDFTLCTHFGLFTGVKSYNFGFGPRPPQDYKVFKEHKDVYNLNITISVIVFILCAIGFGLVATIFGLVNTLTVPIETIHGPTGLYIWNAIGALFSFVAWILYLTLYHTDLKHNVLNDTDTNEPNYFKTDQVKFGYSYWLLIIGSCLFILNILFVFLAQCVQDPKFLWRKRKEAGFSGVAWILYLVLFYTELTKNILSEGDQESPYHYTTDTVKLSYSYWLLIVSFVLFLLNILLAISAQCVQDPDSMWRNRKTHDFDTAADNPNKEDVGLGMMY